MARRFFSLLIMLGAVLATTASASAARRIALVIGNATYVNTPALTNSANDAEDMANALKRVGFEVIFERNGTKREIEQALVQFARAARDSEAALFYYAGHGLQFRGHNYLMPVDAKLEDEFSLNFEMTRVDDVLNSLEQSRGVKILILDACRNNPLADRLVSRATSRDIVSTRGLARIDRNEGMVVAYATQANQVAADGNGRNSPFTAALVQRINQPGLEIGTLFRRVAADVFKSTGGRQQPELSVSLLGEFYFAQADNDVTSWAKVRGSEEPDLIREFIARHRDSPLVVDALQRLATLEREQTIREQSLREQLAQQQARREQLAREQAIRDQIAREKAIQEQLTREIAARERLVQEQAARERQAQEDVARQQALRDQIAREKAIQEQLTREMAARERLAQEQAARDRQAQEEAARQRSVREQRAREQTARDRLAQEQANRERLAQEQANRQRLAQEQAARERLAQEQANRERLVQEQAARERLAQEQAAQKRVQTALLTPAPDKPAPAAVAPLAGEALVKQIKTELKRVGCYFGSIDGNWAVPQVKPSVEKFVKYASVSGAIIDPSVELLDSIRAKTGRVCPLQCSPREIERNGVCVAKHCAVGSKLTASGACEKSVKTAARPPSDRPTAGSPPGPDGRPRGWEAKREQCFNTVRSRQIYKQAFRAAVVRCMHNGPGAI
jgi:hypothetical protein